MTELIQALLGDRAPIGLQRVSSEFDLSNELRRIQRVANKDSERILAFIPAIIDRVSTLTMEIGLILGSNSTETVPSEALNKSMELGTFIRETMAVISMWEKQARDFGAGDLFGDPTKEEREVTRIWAKRNQLPQKYLDVFGVSEGTPATYPENFTLNWL